MSKGAATRIAVRLDRLPPSRTVWIIVILISLGGVFEFYDLFFTGYVAPGMIKSGLFTVQSLGFFASLGGIRLAGFGTFVFSTFAGLWVGVVLLGHLPDRFGRRAVFAWSLVCYVSCTVIMAFQQTGEMLNIWRFIAGLGFAMQLVTIDAYISELIPGAERGRAFPINQFITFSVVPIVALLAWLLVPTQPPGLDGWRWVVLIGSVGAAVVWLLLMLAFSQASAAPMPIGIEVLFTLASSVMSYAYHTYQAELYPTRIQARAVGFVYSWSRLAAAFAGLATGYLMNMGSVLAVAGFISIAMAVGIAVIGLFGPTTSGKTLEHISH